MPGNFTHQYFIQHFKKMGFKLTLPGLCAGFAEAAKIYFLRGNEYFFRLQKLIQYLAFSEPDELFFEMEACKRISGSEDVATLLKEIYTFFETVSMFAQPTLYTKELGESISQTKVSAIAEYVERTKYPSFRSKKILSFPVMLAEQDDLAQEYLKILIYIAKVASMPPAVKFSVGIDSFDHRVMLSFNGAKRQWFMCDINQLECLGKPLTNDKVLPEIFKALSGKTAQNIGFDTAIYCEEAVAIQFEPILAEVQREVQTLYKKNYLQLLQKKTRKDVNFMHLVAKFGYADIMKELLYLHPALISNVTAMGIAPLEIAAEQKHNEVKEVLKQSLQAEKILSATTAKVYSKPFI